MSGIAHGRLREERKSWRKDHPFGFVARPRTSADGSTDLLNWDAVVPGKKGGLWEGCELKLVFEFSEDYPCTAPVVKFTPILWHMNVTFRERLSAHRHLPQRLLLIGVVFWSHLLEPVERPRRHVAWHRTASKVRE